jgi:hypothetical protein
MDLADPDPDTGAEVDEFAARTEQAGVEAGDEVAFDESVSASAVDELTRARPSIPTSPRPSGSDEEEGPGDSEPHLHENLIGGLDGSVQDIQELDVGGAAAPSHAVTEVSRDEPHA